jgi:hypothetical protein
MCKGHPDPEVSQRSRAPIQIPGNAFQVVRCACRTSLRGSIPRRGNMYFSVEKVSRAQTSQRLFPVLWFCIVLTRFDADPDPDPPLNFDSDPDPNPDCIHIWILPQVIHMLEIGHLFYFYSYQC